MDDLKNNLKQSVTDAGDKIKSGIDTMGDEVKTSAEAVKNAVGDAKSAASAVVDPITPKANSSITGILIAVGVLALALGGFFLMSNMNTSDDSAAGRLKEIGKLVAERNFTEATELFDMDQIIENMIQSDSIWTSALAQQGVTSPTPEQITQIRDLVVKNEQVFNNFKSSIKQSFVDAIQGDDIADPDLLAFFTSLKEGSSTLDIKIENDEAYFEVGQRKEKWHMKKIDGKWKVYKIVFSQPEQTSTTSETSVENSAVSAESSAAVSSEATTVSTTAASSSAPAQ